MRVTISPWQNGRVERFFGTLKAALKILPAEFTTADEIPYLLQNFSGGITIYACTKT